MTLIRHSFAGSLARLIRRVGWSSPASMCACSWATPPGKGWACLREHVLYNRPGVEVGKELGLPANSAYVNASRVLRHLRARCTQYEEDPGNE
jgi:hypothetical protein